MTRWLRLLAVLFAAGLLLAACGDDDGDSDAAGGDEPADEAAADDCGGDVCLTGLSFVPDSLSVAVGDTVTWASIDSPEHTVTADDGSFEAESLNNGETFDLTFDEPGEFPYHCEIHPSMTGVITVE